MNVLHAPLNIGSRPLRWPTPRTKSVGGWGCREGAGRSTSSRRRTFPGPRRFSGPRRPGRALAPRGLRPFLYGLRHCRQFDVLHLNFGKSLLRLDGRLSFVGRIDLPLWKALGKRVFMTFQGCDPGFARSLPIGPIRLAGRESVRCRSAVRHWIANGGVGTPSAPLGRQVLLPEPRLAQVRARRRFLPYASYGGEVGRREPAGGSGRPLRVVHAPTKRAAKGTDIIMAASAALQASQPHELVIVENCPRKEALRRYAEADVLVDQVRAGWYGGLAVEAMSMGIPVVAYLDAGDLSLIPTAMRAELPVVNASPDTLPAVLASLLDSPAEHRELGERGMAFVRRWHHPVKIARRMLELYADPALRFWDGYDPAGEE